VRAVLRLKRDREQRARTHPWIFKGDVADAADVAPGSTVTVVDAAGRFVGRGFYNPRPALCCRLLTWLDEPLDETFFRRRIDAALAWRTRGRTDLPALGRFVWSEADGLPGLVVDRYGPALVVQCSTLGMVRWRPRLLGVLSTVTRGLPIFYRDEPRAAALEGFEPALGWAGAVGPARAEVDEAGVRFTVTFGAGHKTGLYLDQRENRVRAADLAAGRDVLDAFSYTGGFACHALARGARRAVCVESSPEALAALHANLELNGFAARAEVVAANAFDELRRLERVGARFGLIVLDPPPFARSRTTLEAALRGYKDITLRALRLLEPNGHLCAFSCSHHVSETLFEEVCRAAAVDAGARLRIVASLGQARDHPMVLTVPETRYLTGLLLERVV